MATGNLINGTTLNGTITLAKSSGTTLTLQSENSFNEKDISLTLNAQTASPSFKGGAVSGSATATGSGCSISDSTNNSGISITAAASATRAAVLYDGTVSGWVDKSNEDSALSAGSSTALTPTTYYINEVTLPKGKSFGITVYTTANTTTKFVFTTDANGNTTVAET